jgi:adenosylcobinamide-GDP ribazoletransferase
MVRSFKLALQFLTVFAVPVHPAADLEEIGRSSWAFPLVGGLIGGVIVVAYLIVQAYLTPSLSAILIVGLWVVLTGGLHLDGWTDCWDALAASVPPARRLEILKDSRLGTFGALALLLLVAAKIAAVGSERISPTVLFVAPIVGRAAMVIGVHGAGHRGNGMASLWLAGLDGRCVTRAWVLGTVPVLIAGWTGIIAACGAYVTSFCFRRLAESRLQVVNGDVIGAMCELCETTFLLIACVRW